MAKKKTDTTTSIDTTPFTAATIQKSGGKYLCMSAIVSGHQIQGGEVFGECGGKAFAIAEYKRFAAKNLFNVPTVAIQPFRKEPDPDSEFPVVTSLAIVKVDPEKTTTVKIVSQGDTVIAIEFLGDTKGRAFAIVEFKKSSQREIFNAF